MSLVEYKDIKELNDIQFLDYINSIIPKANYDTKPILDLHGLTFDQAVEIEYSLYRCWCRSKNYKFNDNSFKIYAREKNMNFWIKKKIAETYLGHKFEYNHELNKWEAAK